jgi:hypothetical protein
MKPMKLRARGAGTVFLVAAALACSVFVTGAHAVGEDRLEVKQIVIAQALETTVSPSLAMALAKVESDFQATAESWAGARGVMQIMPATAEGHFGVDPDALWDARYNVELGLAFLEHLLDVYGGRQDLALSHYYSGRVEGTYPAADVHPIARDYVAKVERWESFYGENEQTVLQMAYMADLGSEPPETIVIAQVEIAKPEVPAILRAPKFENGQRLPAIVTADPKVLAESDKTAIKVDWATPSGSTLDDFGGDLEGRLQNARDSLDDFDDFDDLVLFGVD